MSSRPGAATFRRPFDGFASLSTFLRDQTTQVKPLKNALYNVVVVGGLALILGVGLVLWPFFKPMLWSFLFGAVLYPAKRKISYGMHSWLDRVEAENRSFLVSLASIPFNSLECFGKTIVSWILEHLRIIVIGGASMFTVKVLLSVVPSEVFGYLINFMVFSHTTFASLTGSLSWSMVAVLLVVYWLSVVILWTPALSTPFMVANNCLWVLLISFLCSFFGALQMPVFILFVSYCICGLVCSLRETQEEQTSFLARFNFSRRESRVDDESRPETLEVPPEGESLESSQYFKILFYACAVTIAWKHTWLVFLGLIATLVYILKILASKSGLVDLVSARVEQKQAAWNEFIEHRRPVLFPIFLPGVQRLNGVTFKLLLTKSKSYVDDISSILVILLLVFAIIFASVFSFVQIYSETIAVAQLGSNLINRTLTYRPDLIDMLPVDMQSMDDIIDNAHKYGRDAIADYVDRLFNDTESGPQAVKLKHQILTVWDRVIQSYLDRNNEGGNGPRVGAASIYDSLGEIVTNPSTKAGIIEWAKSNLGMIMEIGDSIWLVVKTNITVLLSAFGTCFSIILGGGHAVLKFLFHSIIFFTCLYYLLQSSRERYAPIAMNINSPWGSRITTALEDSISSVLVATLKLSLFHCLFTWLTHTIFGAHIVYLPSVLAALSAAAPFLETYWCSLPAFLDLWLSQDRFWLACLLFLIHFIVPSNFNPIIHSEIKGGGHPYLTGLSIAGGMYLLGLEGAVLGPLLLCLLVVLFDITRSALKDSPRTPHSRQNSLDVASTQDLYSST